MNRRDFNLEKLHWQYGKQHSHYAARLLCSSVGVFSHTLESVWQMCIIMHSNNWCILKWAAQEGRRETMHLFMHLPIYRCFFAEKQPLIYAHLHKRKRRWRRFFCGSKGSWCPFRTLSLSPRYALLNSPLNYSATGWRYYTDGQGTRDVFSAASSLLSYRLLSPSTAFLVSPS